MSTNYESMMKNYYDNEILQAAQQSTSLIEPLFKTRKSFDAEQGFFHRIGKIDLQPELVRGQKIIRGEFEHTRRAVSFKRYHHAVTIYSFDEQRGLINGIGPEYLEAQKQAVARHKDKICINACTSSVREGKNGENLITFDDAKYRIFADGSSVTNQNGTATFLTSDKLLKALDILRENDVPTDEKVYCILTPKQQTALLSDNVFKNRDYLFRDPKTIYKSDIGVWNGIEFVVSNLLNTVADNGNTSQEVLLVSEQAIAVAMPSKDAMKTSIDKIINEVAQPYQFYTDIVMGAVRRADEKVVAINCKIS